MIQSEELRSSRISLTTNSTSRNKFMRKPTDKRKNSRSKSKEDPERLSYSGHFIKNLSHVSNQPPNNSKQPPLRKLRNDIALQNSTKLIPRERQRKREPTPVKSKRQLVKHSPKAKNNEFELEIMMAELESKMMEERKLREKYEKNYLKNMKDASLFRQTAEKLQQENVFLKKQKIQLQIKIGQLEKTILESENNLTNAKNNLERLRQTIKESRLVELQNQNRKVKKQLEIAEIQNAGLKQETDGLRKSVRQTAEENRQLRRKLDFEKNPKIELAKEQYYQKQIEKLRTSLQMQKEEKEQFLEERIKQLEEENHKYRQQIRFLSMRNHIIVHKSESQNLELRRKKEGELKGLRVRYSKMVQELKQKNEELSRSRKDAFLFELSPEK